MAESEPISYPTSFAPHRRGSKDLAQALHRGTYDGVNAAAEWLAEVMRQMVNIQCGTMGTRKATGRLKKSYRAMTKAGMRHGPHSPPGAPPFRESGDGMNSITWRKKPFGAVVGVVAIPGVDMELQNYLAHWDTREGIRGIRRPWLSLFRNYETGIKRIIRRAICDTTGAR